MCVDSNGALGRVSIDCLHDSSRNIASLQQLCAIYVYYLINYNDMIAIIFISLIYHRINFKNHDNNHILTTLLYHFIQLITIEFKQKSCIQEVISLIYSSVCYVFVIFKQFLDCYMISLIRASSTSAFL